MSQDPWRKIEDVTSFEGDILKRLAAPDVATADVIGYLDYQDSSSMLPEQFFTDTDLANYQSACAWWPEHPDLPVQMQKPTLAALCFLYAEPWTLDGGEQRTFLEKLSAVANRANAWMAEHGPKPLGRPRVHPVLPGETEEERTARLNRERVARHRAKPKTPEEQAVADAYAALQEGRKGKREAMAQWDAHLLALETVWLNLKKGM